CRRYPWSYRSLITAERFRDSHDVPGGPDVVDPHGRRAAQHRGRHRRRRPELPLSRRLARQLADEGLARNAYQKRHSHPRGDLRERPEEREIVLDPLAEPDPRIGPDLAAP